MVGSRDVMVSVAEKAICKRVERYVTDTLRDSKSATGLNIDAIDVVEMDDGSSACRDVILPLGSKEANHHLELAGDSVEQAEPISTAKEGGGAETDAVRRA